MNKKIAIRLAVAIAMIILCGVVFLLAFTNSPKLAADVTRQIEVKDGKYEDGEFEIPFVIDRAGKYRCKMSFWPEENPGFITGFYINDKEGNDIWGATAQKLAMDGEVRFMQKGEYKVVFEIITDNDQFRDFYDNHSLYDYEFSEWDGFKDSDILMNYQFVLVRDPRSVLPLIAILCGALGLVFAAILSISFVKGKEVKFEYDERMLLSRYRSEERALFVIVAGMVIIFLLSIVEDEYPFGAGLQVFSVLILGITVAAIDSILHDGFFAMNYNKKGYVTFEIITCLLCLVASFFAILYGDLYMDGKVTIFAVFPILSLMQIAIFTALIIKHKKDSTED